MSISDVLNQLPEEERLLYLSAVSVKDSAFWEYVISELNEIAEGNKGELLTQTMKGNQKEALIAACKIQAIGFVKEKLDFIIESVTVMALNQEQEEGNG